LLSTTMFFVLCLVWVVWLTAIKAFKNIILEITSNLFVNIKDHGTIKILYFPYVLRETNYSFQLLV
jgi:hypothetical protein